MGDSTITARQLWAATADELGDRAAARWLCEEATGLDGDAFLAELDDPVTEPMVAHLDAMLARYRAGEPLQYVLGRWGFRHLDLAVDRRVLIPRPETERVAGVAIELARARHEAAGEVLVADLGTGSGAIGLSLASELPLTGTTVWITDVSADALDVARANLAGIGRSAKNVRVGQGSWFEALPDGTQFDVIVANPPYVAVGSPELDESVRDWEPHLALIAGAAGLDAIAEIVGAARGSLRPGGWLVLEIGADQGDAVAALFAAAGFVAVDVRRDTAGNVRVALAQAPIA